MADVKTCDVCKTGTTEIKRLEKGGTVATGNGPMKWAVQITSGKADVCGSCRANIAETLAAHLRVLGRAAPSVAIAEG